MRWVLVCSVLFVVACSDDNKHAGAIVDMGRVDDVRSDVLTNDASSSDASTQPDLSLPDPGECAAKFSEGLALGLDPSGESGQFYSASGFDGANIWVVYNRPESAEVRDEAIFVVRLGCDGEVLTAPTQISPAGADARNYSPTMASRNGRTYVVWVHQPNGGNEKQLLYVGFRADGSRLVSEPIDITPAIGDEPLSETIWQPDLAAGDDGATLVAEVLGTETQVVLERFAPDGTVLQTFLANEEKGVDQKSPSVGVDRDNITWVVWTRYRAADPNTNTVEEPDSPAYVSYEGSSTVPREGAPVVFPAAGDQIPLTTVSPLAGPNGEMFIAYHYVAPRQSLLAVRQLGVEGNVSTGAGTPANLNFRPSVVSSDGGGAVAWYRYTTSPLKNSVVLQAFAVGNNRLELGPETVVLPTYDAMPPYGPGLVALENDDYFVTYTQGATAPQTRVFGRLVRATRP